MKKQVLEKELAVDEIAIKGKETWPDQQLKDKFKEYWGYRCGGNSDRSLMMEAPYVREMIYPNRYNTFIRGSEVKNWTGIKIEKIVQVTAQLIEIDFYLKYLDRDNIMADVFIHDSWIIMGNQWYHAFKDPFIMLN